MSDIFDFVKTIEIPSHNLMKLKTAFNSDTTKWNPHTWMYKDQEGLHEFTLGNELLVAPLHDVSISQDLISFLLSEYTKSFPLAECTGFSHIRLNRYTPTTDMDYHWDRIHSLFDGSRTGVPILSIVGLVTSCLSGGEFKMVSPLGDTKTFLTEEGTAIVFPSTFIYAHEVTKVEQGVRDSFVSWAY